MQTSESITSKKTIGNVTYTVKSTFNGDNSGTISEKIKRVIEEKIVKAPLKSEK